MKRITLQKILLIAVVILIETLSAGKVFSQWVVQSSGVSADLYDLKFINRYTGWAVGSNGTIIKTTNGGINWNLVPNPAYGLGKNINKIHPIDSNIYYYVGPHDLFIKTTNNGVNWIIIRNGPLHSHPGFGSLFFLNKDTGWASSRYSIFKTTNGGITLDSFPTDWFEFYDIKFKNALTGIASGNGVCYKTTNGDYNWFNTQVPINGLLYPFQKISVVGNYVWLVGNGKKVYRSTNYADSWDTVSYIPSYPQSTIYSSYFANINTGWAGGSYGYLYKTTNSGYNWIRENTIGDQRFWGAIWFYNDSIGWGSGGAGKIMHTTTGGQSLVNISTENELIPSEFNLSQNYPNPFNSETKILYQLPENSIVTLVIYDILGREVKRIINSENKIAGSYIINLNTDALSSGVYFYKLTSSGKKRYSEIKKMVVIK